MVPATQTYYMQKNGPIQVDIQEISHKYFLRYDHKLIHNSTHKVNRN